MNLRFHIRRTESEVSLNSTESNMNTSLLLVTMYCSSVFVVLFLSKEALKNERVNPNKIPNTSFIFSIHLYD